MIKLRGYIFSRTFMDERVPQNIQNLAIRDYCSKNKIIFLLSYAEYAMKNSHSMLRDAITDKDNNGVVAYSIFQLPFDDLIRENYLKKIVSLKKEFHFVLENIILSNLNDAKKIEEIWFIKKNLVNSINITNA